jgi:hypothetical protein
MDNQEETSCQKPEAPVLCVNNCGYFGSVATMSMCSKCHRDFLLRQSKQLQKAEIGPSGEKAEKIMERMTSTAGPSSEPASSPKVAAIAIAPEIPQSPKGPARCYSCRKKVGLAGFECRCGQMFCGTHRYSDKHDCSFDYKAHGRDSIAKANPVVKADKMEKI